MNMYALITIAANILLKTHIFNVSMETLSVNEQTTSSPRDREREREEKQNLTTKKHVCK